jgi:hypothetical protein
MIPGAAGAEQDIHVTRVQQVEDAVGEDDAPRLSLTPGARIGPAADLRRRIARRELTGCAQKIPSA